jgi:hypothetical protein
MNGLVQRVLLVACLLLTGLAQAPRLASADEASAWLPGPNAVGDDTYAGFIDSPAPGSTVNVNSTITVAGWIVDRTASGWTGIDDVEIYLGLQEQGAPLLMQARIGVQRADVVSAFGNPFWASSGFTASFASNGLVVGSNQLTIYAHTPDKGWWYRQIEVRVPAPPDRPFADDPLLIVREAVPSLDVTQHTGSLVLRGYAIDRNMPTSVSVGVGGSGVSQIQTYLDGPRNNGTFLGNATLGQKNREATGFGERFLMSGFEVTVHPTDFTVDRHELFVYATSAYWPNETLVIIPFSVN